MDCRLGCGQRVFVPGTRSGRRRTRSGPNRSTKRTGEPIGKRRGDGVWNWTTYRCLRETYG